MKNVLLLIALVVMSMSFTSCSSEVVVDAKVKVAEKVKEVVEKELNKAFEGISVEGVDCSLEVKESGDYIYDKVSDFLKVPSEGNAIVKSISSLGIMQKACVYVVDKGLLYMIDKSGDSNRCLKELGRVKVVELADKACARLEI